MADQSSEYRAAPTTRDGLLAIIVLITSVYACSIYANLSFAVRRPADFRFFPPFRPYVDANENRGLAGENLNIARSLTAGQGFSHPFDALSGPTAWMPPVLPCIEAGLLWICAGDRDAVMTVVIFLQINVLLATGLLVILLVRRTTQSVGTVPGVMVFLVILLCHFGWCFQNTQDCWLVMLAVDCLIAGFCWWRPLNSWSSAAGWGVLGGLCALVNPIVGLTWGTCSVVVGVQRRSWSRLALTLLVGGLTLTPWTARNYLVFGRLIPIKSNLAYELYQSQCLQPDGLLRVSTFTRHPYVLTRPEGQEYRRLGESAYMDRKWEQFQQSVWSDPADFVQRIGRRFLAATLWYVPNERSTPREHPLVLWCNRLIHPLPFLALLVLIFTARRNRLLGPQWALIGIYLLYLLPYIVVSYYDRYAVPLLGAKVLLVLCAADRWPPGVVQTWVAASRSRLPDRTRTARSRPADGTYLLLPDARPFGNSPAATCPP